MKSKFLIGLASLIGTLLLVEVVMQIIVANPQTAFRPKENDKLQSIHEQAMVFVQKQINTLWHRKLSDRATIYEPPFQVFVNRGYNDKVRMQEIARQSKLPPNTRFTQQNFLRLNKNKEAGLYTVSVNSLGFRGPEYSPRKKPNTYRIMTLGSYPAFGHGVNDNETYSYFLEKNLNQLAKKKTNFEVWNWGRQGGTSIMGAALLKHEIDQYSPDLILWDYGWIEMYLTSDHGDQDEKDRLRTVNINPAIQTLLQQCHKNFSFMATCKQLVKKYEKIGLSEVITGWVEAMSFLKSWARERNLPVIFLRHGGVTMPREAYEVFNKPQERFYFLETNSAMEKPLTPEEFKTFWGSENWLNELGYSSEDVAKMNLGPWLMLHADAIQYNGLGYKRIATVLTDFIWEHRQELKIPLK